MNKTIYIFLLLLGALNFCNAQEKKAEDWSWLLGNWKGIGSGKPGEGGGVFSFEYQLNKTIIVRKSSSEYTAKNNSKVIHEDLMIIYPDKTRAVYFDNESHVINYTVSYSDKNIVFLSDKVENAPIFRLTYTLLENNEINTKFEFSQDGKNFINYVAGKSKKID